MKSLKVICEVSNKHCHLTEEALKKSGLNLTKLKDLSQPGQWVSKEYYNDGQDNFRVILPSRETDQFELSLTDWIKRFGRDAEPKWKRNKESGYVVTLRHLHISDLQAEELGLKDGDFVSIRNIGIRAGQFDKVLVRVNSNFDFRVHLDTDEANALYIKNGDEVELVLSNKRT
ncbi:MAG: PduL/EutD family phosphate acyltransferase [bacterium]|nr:PduL/EutD family phosphate acyltransferase [bacterium]